MILFIGRHRQHRRSFPFPSFLPPPPALPTPLPSERCFKIHRLPRRVVAQACVGRMNRALPRQPVAQVCEAVTSAVHGREGLA